MEKVYDLLLKIENKKEIIFDWIYEDKVIYDEDDESYHYFDNSGVYTTDYSKEDFEELIPLEGKKNIYLARKFDWDYSCSVNSIFEFLKHLKECDLDLESILALDNVVIKEKEDILTITIKRS